MLPINDRLCTYIKFGDVQDCSWHEFIRGNNVEPSGIWGNFVNRTLAFIIKYLGGHVPDGQVEAAHREKWRKASAM